MNHEVFAREPDRGSYEEAKIALCAKMLALGVHHSTQMTLYTLVQKAWQVQKRRKHLHTYCKHN